MGASRLPGKVLLGLSGRTGLSHVVGRVAASGLDAVVVATTVLPGDDPVAAEAARAGAEVFRGSEQDVLDRYYQAALRFEAEAIVRITADCPLLDPDVVRAMARRFRAAHAAGDRLDYLSNTIERTFPRGQDAEVIALPALSRAWRDSTKPHEREHVTPYVYQHPELFRIAQFRSDIDLSELRWTLDTPEDYSMIKTVYAALGADRFSTAAVLAFLRTRPDVTRINAHIVQKSF